MTSLLADFVSRNDEYTSDASIQTDPIIAHQCRQLEAKRADPIRSYSAYYCYFEL